MDALKRSKRHERQAIEAFEKNKKMIQSLLDESQSGSYVSDTKSGAQSKVKDEEVFKSINSDIIQSTSNNSELKNNS